MRTVAFVRDYFVPPPKISLYTIMCPQLNIYFVSRGHQGKVQAYDVRLRPFQLAKLLRMRTYFAASLHNAGYKMLLIG